MNKTFAVFANGGTMTTAQTALWQYDYGQILVVQGIELPNAYEVQFCNAGDSTTITSVGDSTGVVIPDQFLQNGETIYAYIYLHTGNADGETEYKITIPVMDRAEPTDIEPTPAQESTIGQLIAALNAGVEAAEEAAEKGPQIIDGYWHIWDAEAGEYVNTNVKAEGEDGEPGTPGTDGSNAWMIDVAYTNTVGSTIRAQTEHLIGPPDARPMYGDVLFVSDGRFGNIINPGTRIIQVSTLGDLHGDPGEDGYSPVVTITEIEGGHRVTITDEDHPQGQSFDVLDGQGGSGSSDYDDLTNKPQINSVTLSGNKSLSDLGVEPEALVVNVTQSIGGPSTDYGFTEIKAASDAGKRVVAVYDNCIYSLYTVDVPSSTAVFTSVFQSLSHVIVIVNQGVHSVGTVYNYIKPRGGIPASDLASAVQTSLGKADTALQSAPVTSVNGQTGAVSLTIPSTAADVGAVAANQGAANANKVLKVNSYGNVVPEDNRFVVTLTPTAADYSGVMDKNVAEINAAWGAGKEIWFRIYSGTDFTDVPCDRMGKTSLTYPSFNAAMLYDEMNMFVLIYTETTSNGSKQTYSTKLYPLATGQWTGGSY